MTLIFSVRCAQQKHILQLDLLPFRRMATILQRLVSLEFRSTHACPRVDRPANSLVGHLFEGSFAALGGQPVTFRGMCENVLSVEFLR